VTGAPRFLCLATQTLSDRLPSPSLALTEPDGLLAAGGSLAPAVLREAYQRGIFPWFSEGQPLLWWSPDPRTVIEPASLHVSRSLQRSLRRHSWQITLDRAFGAVIRACAAPRAETAGTWLCEDMVAAYETLHRLGHAHSLECWREGALVGGIYGVRAGAVFCGESMFSRVTDASKVAMLALCRRLNHWGFALLDCQVANPHLMSMGSREVPRQDFLRVLADAALARAVSPQAWQMDPFEGRVE